jgi:hypothetical protein
MTLNARNIPSAGGSGNRPDPMEAGTYPARLVQIITLGVQKQRPYKGEEKPPALELMLTYEFLDEFMKDEDGNDIDDKPRWLSETFAFHNLDAELAKSTKRYYALDPNGEHDGDWSELISAPCMVTVTQSEGKGKNAGKIYENVASVSAMRPKEAAKAPALINPPKVFDFYNPDMEVFEKLPEWLQTKMKEAVDFDGSALEEALERAALDGKPKEKKKEVKAPKQEGDDGEEW